MKKSYKFATNFFKGVVVFEFAFFSTLLIFGALFLLAFYEISAENSNAKWL